MLSTRPSEASSPSLGQGPHAIDPLLKGISTRLLVQVVTKRIQRVKTNEEAFYLPVKRLPRRSPHEEIFRCSRHEVPLPRAGWTGDRWFFVDFRHSLEAEVKSEISRPGHDSAMACAQFAQLPKETSPAAYVFPSSSFFFSLIRPRLPSRTLSATWADARLFRHWRIVRFSACLETGFWLISRWTFNFLGGGPFWFLEKFKIRFLFRSQGGVTFSDDTRICIEDGRFFVLPPTRPCFPSIRLWYLRSIGVGKFHHRVRLFRFQRESYILKLIFFDDDDSFPSPFQYPITNDSCQEYIFQGI